MLGEAECFFEWLHVPKASCVPGDSAAEYMERTTLFAVFPAQFNVATNDPQHAVVVQFSWVLTMFQELVDP